MAAGLFVLKTIGSGGAGILPLALILATASLQAPLGNMVASDPLVEGPQPLQNMRSGADIASGLPNPFQPELRIQVDDPIVEPTSTVLTLSEVARDGGLHLWRAGNLAVRTELRISVVAISAEPGVDFAAITNKVLFEPGQSSLRVPIEVLDDLTLEGDESFALRFEQLDPSGNVTRQFTVTGRILDNEQAGGLDVSFAPDPSEVDPGRAVLSPDGKIYFEISSSVPLLARFQSDGRHDPVFAPESLVAAGLRWVQPDLKIMLAAQRLLPSGALDNEFVSLPGSRAIALQPDGRILAAGETGSIIKLRRFNADGSPDGSFREIVARDRSEIFVAALQPDRRILVGGSFDGLHGRTNRGLMRLFEDGSPDPSFHSPLAPEARVGKIVLQPDGRILAAIPNTAVGTKLVRLEPDGTVDQTFSQQLRLDAIYDLALQADGRWLVAGSFRSIDGRFEFLMRLEPNGAPDHAFRMGRTLNDVYSVQLDQEGRILISGRFTEVDGLDRDGLARLQNDSSAFAGSIAFERASLQVREDSVAEVELRILRKGSSFGQVIVNLGTVHLSSRTRSDFDPVHETIVFAPGETSRAVRIPLPQNARPDSDATLEFWLANPIGGAVLGFPASAQVILLDDDPDVTFSGPVVRVEEALGTQQILLRRTGALAFPVEVEVRSGDRSARAGLDFAPVMEKVSFAAGQTEASIPLTIFEDEAIEETEEMMLSLAPLDLSTAVGPPLVIRIKDSVSEISIAEPFLLSFPDGFRFDEQAGAVQVDVLRTGRTNNTVSVSYTTVDGLARAGSDYEGQSGTLTFAPGEKRKSILIPLVKDLTAEGLEDFSIQLLEVQGLAVLEEFNSAQFVVFESDHRRFANRLTLAGTSPRAEAINHSLDAPIRPEHYLAPNHSLWWQWTAPQDGFCLVQISGEDDSPQLAVFSGTSLTNLVLLTEPVWLGRTIDRASFRVSAGSTYQIAVGSNLGRFTLSLDFFEPPPNDNFTQRPAFEDNVTVRGRVLGGSVESVEARNWLGASSTVWWSWTPVRSGPVTIQFRMLGDPVNERSGLLELFKGASLLNLELIAQISTWTGEPTSSASFQAEAGTEYQLRLSSLVIEPGEFELQIVQGTAPHVTILSPKIGAPFEMGAEFFAQAHALDSDGRIVNVGWYLSDQPEHGYRFLGSRTDAPFTFAITNVLPGRFWLQAVATDDQGARSASVPVPYRVRPPNDDYARAIVLEGERVRSEFWIHGAGNEPGEESITGIGGETIWWRWTAPETGLYTIAATCGSSRPLLGVFDATDQISSLNDQLFVSTMDNSFASEFPDTVRGSIAVEKGRSYAIVASTFSSRPEATVEIAITPGTPPLMEWAFPTAEGNVNLMAGSKVMLKLNLLNPSLALPAVELFINGHRESRLTEPPYEWLFEVGEGYYEFYARATDANGLVTVLPRRTFAGRHAPPPNDHFIDRINLSGLSVQVEGNAAGATSETNEPPVQSNTVWYAWTAPESRTFSLVLENGWDLHLYRGGALTELVPIGSIPPWENYWQPISRIWFTAEAGVEYQIAIGNTREINLRIFPNDPPLLRMIHPLDGSLFEAGSVVPLQVEATDADNGISSVEFFLGTDPNAMQPVVPPQKPPYEYEFVLPSDRVATFYFYAEATDREGIKVKSALVRFTSYWPPLANDHFANRLDVGGDNFIVTASLATATRESGEPLHGGYTAWWSWMAPASGAAHLLAESAFVAGLSVYQGESMTQLQLIAAAAELALNKPTSVSFRVEAGQRYEITLSSLVGTPGPVTLTGRLGVPPTIRIVSPLHNQTFHFGSIIRLEAEVVDPDNDVELVEWMLDGETIGVASAAPFAHEFPASDRLPSVHWIQARVTDGKGWFALSLPISIATEGEPMPAPVPPMNDDFDQAMVLPEVALVSGTFFNATIEPGEPVPNNLTLAGSVWWRWTAPESGFLILNNSYPPVWEHSPRLTIYRGDRVINLIPQTPLETLNVSGQIQERYAVAKGIAYHIRVLVGNAQRLTVFFDLHLETAVRPALHAITISGGMTTIQGSGLPGTWLVLEHSEDLIRWFPLQTKSVPADGQIEFNDPDFLKASRRFYRLVAP